MSHTTVPEPFAALLDQVPRNPLPLRDQLISYDHDGTPLEGYLVEPHGDQGGPRKAVLILHAWMGVGANVQARAQMVAHLGYTGFAADVYGAGVRPTTVPEMKAESERYYADLDLMRGRVEAGFAVLTERGFDPQDIVVIGYCFGGTAALEFARTGQPFAGVVAFHPRLLIRTGDAAAISAPVLIASGADDDIVPDSDLTAFMDELREVPELDWRITVYSGAPHAFTVPGERYRPLADARSWREFVDFLGEVAPADDSGPGPAPSPGSDEARPRSR